MTCTNRDRIQVLGLKVKKNQKCNAIHQTALDMQKDGIAHLGRQVLSHVLYFNAEAATGACPVAKLELKSDGGT